jgi:hypothetical protein
MDTQLDFNLLKAYKNSAFENGGVIHLDNVFAYAWDTMTSRIE